MLWLKAWLELRYRLVFTLIFLAFPMILIAVGRPASAPPVPPENFLGTLAVFWANAHLVLAASGIRTQSANLQPVRGGHKSVQFTLSLPVSRLRLLAVRTAVGMLALTGIVLLNCTIMFLIRPNFSPTPLIAAQYIFVVLACGSAFYGISLVLSTFLDEVMQNWIGILSAMAIGFYSMRQPLPAFLDFFRAMGANSPIITQTIPWTPVIGALSLAAVLFVVALKIVQSREF